MVEEQHKATISHSTNFARDYSYEQGFSYQIVSFAVTESREVTK